jgi:hypothetical protein
MPINSEHAMAIKLLSTVSQHLQAAPEFEHVSFECDNDSGELVIVVRSGDATTFVIKSVDVHVEVED